MSDHFIDVKGIRAFRYNDIIIKFGNLHQTRFTSTDLLKHAEPNDLLYI